jgi:CBS-domain-containing membrane protein
MEVREVMTARVQCCTPDDSLEHAARLMWDNDCGCLPVCTVADGKAPAIGLITDRDICMCALFQGAPLSALHVHQAMTDRLLACQPGDTLEEAERVMRQGQVRRLPVLSAEGQLLGIVSLADLARTAAREGTTRIIGHDISESEVGHTLAAICQRQTAPAAVAL